MCLRISVLAALFLTGAAFAQDAGGTNKPAAPAKPEESQPPAARPGAARDARSAASKPDAAKDAKPPTAAKSVLDFSLPDIDGKSVALSRYKGKVMLLVNVASKCGYTPQYEGLEALYEKHAARGLAILGFPANNFGAQEPGTNAEIKSFCSTRYTVTFDMFSKVSVKGDDCCDLYKFLTSKETNPQFAGEIKWNFTKFLVDRDGKVVARFEPRDTPEKIAAQIEKLLESKPAEQPAAPEKSPSPEKPAK